MKIGLQLCFSMRCRSFLPDLMTVRAVVVRAAMEKKKYNCNSVSPQCVTSVTTAHLCCCFVGLGVVVCCFLVVGEQFLISF